MKFTWWRSGDYNAICDVCGFKFKASDLRYTGDIGSRAGLMACRDCYDPPHPQEFIRPIQDQTRLPWTRHEGSDTFTNVTYANTLTCTPLSMLAQAGYGAAGCMVVGNVEGQLIP